MGSAAPVAWEAACAVGVRALVVVPSVADRAAPAVPAAATVGIVGSPLRSVYAPLVATVDSPVIVEAAWVPV